MHIKAPKRVLGHMAGYIGQGTTFHRNTDVVHKVYRNKLIAAPDADFSHQGNKSISGVAIMIRQEPKSRFGPGNKSKSKVLYKCPF